MNKIITFIRYLKDFIKKGEFVYILTSIKYQVLKKPTSKTRLYKSSLGNFVSRKGSIDFMFANYAYEWNVKSFILDHYKDYNVFIDVGSNIGTYCIMMHRNGLKSFAFEPAAENFKALKTNLMLNKLESDIRIFNFGLGASEHSLDFVFDPVNTGASHKFSEDEPDGVREVIEVKPFDSIYPDLGLEADDRILMKIDVEGMELEVLKGAQSFLKKFDNLLIIMESKHSEFKKLKAELEKAGSFKFMVIDDFNIATKKIK